MREKKERFRNDLKSLRAEIPLEIENRARFSSHLQKFFEGNEFLVVSNSEASKVHLQVCHFSEQFFFLRFA